MKTINNYKKRLDFIDMSKGFAMICIILGHFYAGCYPIWGRIIYPFHVPIFFLISGFFITSNFCQAPKIFIKKKCKNLLLPYVYSCIVMMIVSMVQNVISGEFESILLNEGQLLCASIYGGGGQNALYPLGFEYNWIGVLWFLPALFEALMLTYFIIYFIRGIIIQILCVLFVLILGLLIAKYIPWQMPFTLTSGMTAIIYVYVGYLFSKIDIKTVRNINIFFAGIVGLAGWYIAIRYNWAPIHSQAIYGSNIKIITITIICSILASIAIILIMLCYSTFSERPKVLEYIGRNSIVVLCVHAVELRVINWTRIFNELFIKFKLYMNFKEQMMFRVFFIYIVTVIIVNIMAYMKKHINEY